MHRVISPQPIHQKPHSAAKCILATCESNWAAYMNMHELPPAADAGIYGMDNAKATCAQKAASVAWSGTFAIRCVAKIPVLHQTPTHSQLHSEEFVIWQNMRMILKKSNKF